MSPSTDSQMAPPSAAEIYRALRVIGRAIDNTRCLRLSNRYHFQLGREWTLELSPEDAARFRLQACYHGRPRTTLWVLVGDDERLAKVAVALLEEVEGVREGV